MSQECLVCDKHGGDPGLMPGGPVGDELIVVSHVSTRSPGQNGRTVYLGHLFVEPRRHASGLADLTEQEAQAMGWWCARMSQALRDVTGAEHVYAAVIGDGVPHLHVHLLARYPGTPQDYWWTRVDEWPKAARGTEAEVGELVTRLRDYVTGA
jgi:histidine triad (HIT) family protein